MSDRNNNMTVDFPFFCSVVVFSHAYPLLTLGVNKPIYFPLYCGQIASAQCGCQWERGADGREGGKG